MSLARLERVLRERTGLDPASLGPLAFSAAVKARVVALGLNALAAYEALATTNDTEWNRLLEALLVPESWFFRGGRALFDELAQHLLRTATKQNRPARALCVPCGIGEEPYSLAIALHDLGATQATATIEAWDLSEGHLARAASARYTAFSFRETDPRVREQFFQPAPPEAWQLLPEVRHAVRFSRCNLALPANEKHDGPFDLVICRNVFIYLTDVARQQALANLTHWLAPEGLLCLSPSEADRLPRGEFVRLDLTGSLVYQRSTQVPAARVTASATVRNEPRRVPPAIPSEHDLPPVLPVLPALDPLVAIRDAADRGELGPALSHCQNLLSNGPPTADVFSLLGVLHLASGHTSDAYDSFTKALYLQPDHAESLEHLALLSEQRGDRNRAAALRSKLKRSTRGGAS